MPKKKDKLFLDKFKSLNSQDYDDEICWSSSPSSDVENINSYITFNRSHKIHTEKRKRKKSVHKKISNLDIKLISTSFCGRSIIDCEKSLQSNEIDLSVPSSPILQTTRNNKSRCEFSTYRDAFSPKSSPILPMKINKSQIIKKSSPILKVRKQIFNTDYGLPKEIKESKYFHIKEEFDFTPMKENEEITDKKIEEHIVENNDYDIESLSQCSKKIKLDDDLTCKSEECIENIEEYYSSQDSKSKISDYVKTHFDTNCSSGNTSLVISEDLTPKSSSNSDDIQIFTCKSQINSPKNLISVSTSMEIKNESKKVRYKKDGLAYRLSNLLKKQNANLNLWRHEKFLAGNANFIIPKTNCLIFHIRSVEINYGCYLLQAVDEHVVNFLIVINNVYALEHISSDSIFKLYKPYTIKNVNNINLITNVCKFETHLITLK